MKNKIYAFKYCPCIYESGWMTISLHLSEDGAIKAMEAHKKKELDEFNEMYSDGVEPPFDFGLSEDWCVQPMEILP